MKPGTRILLAVLTLFMGVIVLYWGVFYRSGDDDPVLVNDPTVAASDAASSSAPDAPSDAAAADLVPIGTPRPRREATGPALGRGSASAAPVLGREEAALDTMPGRVGDPATDADRLRNRAETPPRTGASGSSLAEPPLTESPTEATREPQSPDRDAQPPSAQPAGETAPAPREPTREPRRVHTPYVVKAGDTLSSIARDWFGEATRWDLIQQANPAINPNNLRIGQVLLLPARDSPRDDGSRARGAAGTYIVRSGDTLSSIARARLGDERRWRIIYEANRRTIGPDPDAIRVGMELIIPARPSADGS